MTRHRTIPRIVAAVLIALFVSGCCNRTMPTANLDPDEVVWKPYIDNDLGFTLEVPEGFTADEDDEGVRFWFSGDSPARVDFVDEETARDHGLWARHEPRGETVLGGLDGNEYVYDHYDGPFCSRMVAFVVPYRDRYLALEFRAARELDDVQRRILESFRIAVGDDT